MSEGRLHNRAYAWGAILLLVLGLWGFGYSFVEWIEEPVDLGYSDDATRNRLLAAELFLASRGVEVERVIGLGLLDDLPPVEDVLFITGTRRALSDRRNIAVLDWVEAGGHLVVVAEDRLDEETQESGDWILDHVEIYLLDDALREILDEGVEDDDEIKDIDEEERGVDEDPDPEEIILGELLREAFSGKLSECWDDDGEDGEYSMTLPLEGNLQANAQLNTIRYLSSGHAPILEGSSPNGVQLIQLASGAGTVTALTSSHIFENPAIHCADHAFILHHLASQGEKTWLLPDPDMPPLSALVWSAMPLSCVGFVLFTCVWAASRSLVLGPRVIAPDPARREILEHLESSAHFLWRHGQLRDTLAELRGEVEKRATRHGSDYVSMDPADRSALLSRITGIAATRVRFALFAEVPVDRLGFTSMMQTLQAVRRQL